jgi:hypothetical protein
MTRRTRAQSHTTVGANPAVKDAVPLAVDPQSPNSAAEAELLERYPIRKPANPNRHFERRGDHLVEVVDDEAFRAIKAYLDNGAADKGKIRPGRSKKV